MSGTEDGPKRIQTEPTLAIDRDKLPPRDKAAIELARESYPRLPPLGLDEPDDVAMANASPEELAEMLRAQRRNAPTLVECPCCTAGMVSVERRAELLAMLGEAKK